MTNQHHENVIVNTTFGIRFWRSDVTNNGYVPFHWHSSIEIVCVMNGQLTFNISGRSYTIHKNEFIVVPSGIVHDVTNSSNSAYVLQIPLTTLTPYVTHPENANFINGQTSSPAYQQIVMLINQLGHDLHYRPAGYRFNCQIVFLQIMKLLFTELRANKQLASDNSRLKDIIIFINDHHQENLTVNQLAQYFGYNSSYLSRLFKQQTGISLIQYVYMVKINQFYQDLLNTNLPIKKLLQKNGLSNERTARKIFKNMFGILPHELRKNRKQH